MLASARQSLIDRAVDISHSLSVVIRSQRRFSGIISQDRLESALQELVKSPELNGITLLSPQGKVIASAGAAPPPELPQAESVVQLWSDDEVTIVSQVDLGQITPPDNESNRPTIVLSSTEVEEQFRQFRSRRPRRNSEAGPDNNLQQAPTSTETNTVRSSRTRPPRRPLISRDRLEKLAETQSLQRFALVLPTDWIVEEQESDLRFRMVVGLLALLALAGLGVAWHGLVRSSQLELRLVRAKQLNDYLREMNLAAAGLAHETRNPLNLIRGMAQMISRAEESSKQTRERSQQITQEVDRVTDQLNDFITYSKPRETRLMPVDLEAIARDVVRTLSLDLEEKSIQWRFEGPGVVVQADQKMLRQVLFNLLINAIQSVSENGLIQIKTKVAPQSMATLEVQDDGPGVPSEIRSEIFKPYFTSHERGTGLGLAVVQQIVLAHDWEIEYRDAIPTGAIFRISRIELSPSS